MFGLVGPLTAYTWKLAARSAAATEETQESLDKDFTLSRIMARLSGHAACLRVPLERPRVCGTTAAHGCCRPHKSSPPGR